MLIVLYVGTQLASSLMMQAPTMDRAQRRLMLLLPLFFVIFIVNFPAGLILYWITTNTWTIGQHWVIRRRIGPAVPVASAAPAASPGGRDGRPAAADRGATGEYGGLSGLLREKPKPEEQQPAAVGSSTPARSGAAASTPQEEAAFRLPALAMGPA